MLRHTRLLIFDLDYLVFDCAQLKAQAVRQSMISLADLIPQNVPLPGRAEAEAGFLDHGSRWVRHLEIGLDEQSLEDLEHAYVLHESRLLESGAGGIYPGIEGVVAACRKEKAAIALGAEASRDYLISVIEQHQLDSLFQITLCTEEFGMGGADEMMVEIMRQAEVNPSETLVLGTRAQTFQAARALDIWTIGCGWGVHQYECLSGSDQQVRAISDLSAAIVDADNLTLRNMDR